MTGDSEVFMDLDSKTIELKKNRTPYCVATIIKSQGSSPRHIGTKMIVTESSSFGTIGGGALEEKVIEDAREQMRHRSSTCKNYPLGAMLGQCCGGEVEVFFEPNFPKKPMFVFGAGHIAEHLCPMLMELGFHVTLIDERPERITLPRFETVHERWNELPSDIMKKINFYDDTHIIVITHEHKHDEEIVRFCLDKKFKYLGCIGSRHKWKRFKERYHAQGIPDELFKRVTSPIGLDFGSETPFEISVSICAELIQLNTVHECISA